MILDWCRDASTRSAQRMKPRRIARPRRRHTKEVLAVVMTQHLAGWFHSLHTVFRTADAELREA